MLTRENFVGLWAGLPVAWTENDEFDEPTYRRDLTRCCEVGIPGVYTGGTSGEFYAQEWDEFQKIARATVEECHRHRKLAMIGCTATSTHGVARRVEFAAKIGADAFQLALPFWMEVADEQVLPFFKEVAKAGGQLPFSIYETKRARKLLSLDQHFGIHEALPNYLMVKATGGTVGDTIDGCRKLSTIVNVFVGEHRWAELGPCGAIGSCSSAVYWNPWVLLRSWTQLRDRDWPGLERHCQQLSAFFATLFTAFGTRGFTDTAYDRLGGRSTGFLCTSLQNRGPYASPNKNDISIMRELFLRSYPEMIHMGGFS